MICKKCGKAIEPNQQSCPHCGYPVDSSEKGNGFWDMAAPQPKSQPVVQTKPIVNQKDVSKATSNRTIPLIIALGALTLCGIVLSVVLFVISKMTGLSESVDSLRSDLDIVKEAVPSVLRIITSPIDQEASEGFTNDSETYLFIVEIEGSVASFKWEKQAANGSWIELEFDSEGNNASLGLSKQEDVTHGYSRILATGLSAEATGTYKCIITSIDGLEKELVVSLAVEEAEPTPAPTPESAEPSETIDPSTDGENEGGDNTTPIPTQAPWWGR